jgi:hypothetical protein
MTNVQEITTAIQQLSREELITFREWFEEFYAEAWDGQLEDDTKAGQLVSLAGDGLANPIDGPGTVPNPRNETKRNLGLLEGKAKVVFADDFKMTDEELVNL